MIVVRLVAEASRLVISILALGKARRMISAQRSASPTLALQLQRELSLGSYKTAWLLCAKLRRAMATPSRNLLSGLVEVHMTEITCRSKLDRAAGNGSSEHGKILVAAAVEIQDLRVGRIRLGTAAEESATHLHAFLAASVALGATAQTGGEAGYSSGTGINDDPRIIAAIDAPKAGPRLHRIFADLKVWALSVYHGLRRKHLQAYLDEFVYRFNRRRDRHAAFADLLGLAAAHPPVTCDMLISLGAKA